MRKWQENTREIFKAKKHLKENNKLTNRQTLHNAIYICKLSDKILIRKMHKYSNSLA